MAATKREWYIIGNEYSIGFQGNYFYAQSFTVGNVGVNEDFKITSVKIEGFRFAAIADNVYAEIKAVDVNEKPTGPALSIGETDPNEWGIGYENRGWYEIPMSEHILSASTQFALILSCPLAVSDFPHWCFNLAGYAGGLLLESSDAGATWAKHTIYDFMFEIWGEPVAVEKKSIGNLSARPDKEIVPLL